MKSSNPNQYAIGVCAAVLLLSACGGLQPSIGAPGAMPQSAGIVNRVEPASFYQVLHRFHGLRGARLYAGLTDVNGTLYGVTYDGGAYDLGTVFSMTTGGTERVLHSFGNGTDGLQPYGGLINVKGTLYGTTPTGGANGYGIVFSVTRAGAEKVLHSFSGADGVNPEAALINVKGTLYGTAAGGGLHYTGTVFSVTATGEEKTLYSFCSKHKCADGSSPEAALINVNGTLYGTTTYGGAYGNGTVFSVTTTGKEKMLYSFGGGSADGVKPSAALINVNGALYGTTPMGGAHGNGTVFSVTTTGKEKVLYSFTGGSVDGAAPYAGLLNVNGTLYGTTTSGGGALGYGTIFSITTSGTEQVLFSFRSADGTTPYAGLINVKSTLYGTTSSGTSRRGTGGGTAFAFIP